MAGNGKYGPLIWVIFWCGESSIQFGDFPASHVSLYQRVNPIKSHWVTIKSLSITRNHPEGKHTQKISWLDHRTGTNCSGHLFEANQGDPRPWKQQTADLVVTRVKPVVKNWTLHLFQGISPHKSVHIIDSNMAKMYIPTVHMGSMSIFTARLHQVTSDTVTLTTLW